MERPRPTNVIKIRNFYRSNWPLLKVYEEFSKMASSLTNILKDVHKLKCGRAVRVLRQRLIRIQILTLLAKGRMCTDVSKNDLGCILW